MATTKPSMGQLLPMLTHLWLCPLPYPAQLAWLSPVWGCLVCLFAGPLFLLGVMLLCPGVTKPLPGHLYVSSSPPKTYWGLCLSAQVQPPRLLSIPGECVWRLGLVGET